MGSLDYIADIIVLIDYLSYFKSNFGLGLFRTGSNLQKTSLLGIDVEMTIWLGEVKIFTTP